MRILGAMVSPFAVATAVPLARADEAAAAPPPPTLAPAPPPPLHPADTAAAPHVCGPDEPFTHDESPYALG